MFCFLPLLCPPVITMRHLITLADVSAAEIQRIFSITEDLKSKFAKGLREPLLPGRMLALLFEKQSLRTRVSFESGMVHLGGSSIMLGDDTGFGSRPSGHQGHRQQYGAGLRHTGTPRGLPEVA